MKQIIRLTESNLHRMIKESVKKVLFERTKSENGLSDDDVMYRRDMNFADNFDDDYEEIIPLYDIFRNGFTFDEYYREKILLDSSLCYKDGQELGVCLNDLCLKYQPNKK